MRTEEVPGHHFGVSVARDEGRVSVRLSGFLDQEGSSLVALWLTPLVLLEATGPILVDLTGLTCLHVDGLETLLDLIELAGHRCRPLRFVVGDPEHAVPLHLDGGSERLIAHLLGALSWPAG